MDDLYKRLSDNLVKLERNLTNMTPEQKEHYRRPLGKLKKEIMNDSLSLLQWYLIDSCLCPMGEKAPGIIQEAEYIFRKEVGQITQAVQGVFRDYDIDAMLKAVSPIRARLRYKVFGAYWLLHCKKTGDKDYPYMNDLIGMEWSAKVGLWCRTDDAAGGRAPDLRFGFTAMLPPTADLMDAAYEAEVSGYVG